MDPRVVSFDDNSVTVKAAGGQLVRMVRSPRLDHILGLRTVSIGPAEIESGGDPSVAPGPRVRIGQAVVEPEGPERVEIGPVQVEEEGPEPSVTIGPAVIEDPEEERRLRTAALEKALVR